jgi:phenylpropionate dioxygenase-like ring-hydroxylating dioxygenase large terminal subunit
MEEPYLSDLWYLALPAGRLPRGRMCRLVLLGQPVLLGRTDDETAFAVRDICPHRGIPLSAGSFDGREVECAYHGWRFDPQVVCTAIPSLVSGQTLHLDRIRLQRYPCREVQGNIWVFFGEGEGERQPVPYIPDLPDERPRLIETTSFPCHIDHAVVGLMDPAHGPFVHRSWWWRSTASMHEKAKRFAPSHLGFTMVRHAPSSNSRAYRILGGKPETEISFQLPGIRVEHVRIGTQRFAGLTAVTPVSDEETRITQVLYWTSPWLTWFKPALRPFVRAFLDQDRRVVAEQQKGLAFDPKLMLINDADVQARWYFSLKKAYRLAQERGDAFVNPVREQVLRWRS